MLGLDNPIHLLFLGVVLLLLFGAKRLPEMGQSLGSGLRGFKDSLSGDTAPSGISAHVAAAQADVNAPEQHHTAPEQHRTAPEQHHTAEQHRTPAQPVA
jgi:sec-independent protein translocase protein TatA